MLALLRSVASRRTVQLRTVQCSRVTDPVHTGLYHLTTTNASQRAVLSSIAPFRAVESLTQSMLGLQSITNTSSRQSVVPFSSVV